MDTSIVGGACVGGSCGGSSVGSSKIHHCCYIIWITQRTSPKMIFTISPSMSKALNSYRLRQLWLFFIFFVYEASTIHVFFFNANCDYFLFCMDMRLTLFFFNSAQCVRCYVILFCASSDLFLFFFIAVIFPNVILSMRDFFLL